VGSRGSSAADIATRLDLVINAEVIEHVLEEPVRFLTRIRAFLMKFEQENESNNPISLVKYTQNRDVAEIVLGPQIDKGPSDDHFKFDSGARLSFGISLRRNRQHSHLVAYRFHFVFKDGHSPPYIRFDLNYSGGRSTLEESRSHLHPGLDDTRLPARVLSPLEVLDRIFLVLDQCACATCSESA
jgi:hypothetical protein